MQLKEHARDKKIRWVENTILLVTIDNNTLFYHLHLLVQMA